MITSPEIRDRIEKCRKLLESDPSSQIFAALAEAFRKNGELDKAFRVCKNGLKVHPKYGSGHVVMAKINLDRGQYDWAEAEIKKAAEFDGRTRTVELLLAEIYIYKGEFAAAIKLLKKLHENYPDNDQISRLLDIAQKIPEERDSSGMAQVASQPGPNSGRASLSTLESQPFKDETVTEVITGLSSTELLKQSITIPGIDGALYINFEGLIVDSEWSLPLDHNVCGAVMGDVGKQLEQELVQNSFGTVKTVLIESNSATFYMIKDTDGLFVFVADSSANLGSIRMRIDKILANFRNEG